MSKNFSTFVTKKMFISLTQINIVSKHYIHLGFIAERVVCSLICSLFIDAVSNSNYVLSED
jgi:hypothetical protein